MPTVLITGFTVTQNLQYSCTVVVMAIASTNYAYLWRDGQTELASVAG